jgi:NADH-quinone oxidoreductase subunit H
MLDALNRFGNGLQAWWTGISASEPLRALMVALFCLVFMLLVVLFVIWMERKVSADIQNRVGPVRTGGPLGFLLQSLADALKLLLKEDLKPKGADRWPFYVAPYLVFLPAFMGYMILPFSATWIPQDVKVGILYYCAISSVPVLGIAIAGWASNNKWSLLGSLRAAAQLISYELPLAFAIICVVMLHGTLETGAIVANQWQHPWLTIITLPALAIFLVAGLAEVSRAPFDLPEAESELVAGFNTEYSGMRFATFFLAEFSASFFISALAVTLFLGGWSLWGVDTWFVNHVFGWHFTDMPSFLQFAGAHFWPGFIMKGFWFVVFLAKTFIVLWILMWIKWTMPRLRIDQVLNFGWKVLLPAALACLLLLSVVGAALSRPQTGAYGVSALALPPLVGEDKPAAVMHCPFSPPPPSAAPAVCDPATGACN